MHLPDGILTTPVWFTADAAAAAALALCLKASSASLQHSRVPLMGVLGAFVFAAQMVNFPVPGGSSGHLLGAVLLAVLLGAATAGVVMFCVLLVQALLFQDGGITALGANFINMAVAGILFAWVAERLARGRSDSVRAMAVFLACWLSVVFGALLAAGELWLSGSVPLVPALLAMGGVHALIGIGEGLLTLACLRFLRSARSQLLEARR